MFTLQMLFGYLNAGRYSTSIYFLNITWIVNFDVASYVKLYSNSSVYRVSRILPHIYNLGCSMGFKNIENLFYLLEEKKSFPCKKGLIFINILELGKYLNI